MARLLIGECPPLSGRGLHAGKHAQVIIAPGEVGAGISFIRCDRTPNQTIPASLEAAQTGPRRTSLGAASVYIHSVEHILCALRALEIYDARVSIDGEEVPALDGSAQRFVQLLEARSRQAAVFSHPWRVMRQGIYRQGTTCCVFSPSADNSAMLQCSISFPHPAIGQQQLRLPLASISRYRARFVSARTFGFLAEASDLWRAGLARGASLNNTLVFDRRGVVNPEGTRFRDEPVRHKMVDALGDLALLPGPFIGQISLHRCSHAFFIATLRSAIAEGIIARPM